MTDDTNPEDRDQGEGNDRTNGADDGDSDGSGPPEPIDADPTPNGSDPTDENPTDENPTGENPTDENSTVGNPTDGETDDAPPDPIVRDTAVDPRPEARPRDDAPAPPGDAGLDGASTAEQASAGSGVEDAFEEHHREPDVEPADTPDERIIPKRTYCERCEYFERPPAVGCTHDGTEIVELVDRRQFRVVNCPVVAEREELAADEADGREPELGDDEHWRGDVGPE